MLCIALVIYLCLILSKTYHSWVHLFPPVSNFCRFTRTLFFYIDALYLFLFDNSYINQILKPLNQTIFSFPFRNYLKETNNNNHVLLVIAVSDSQVAPYNFYFNTCVTKK